jgi:hypothetical protein
MTVFIVVFAGSNVVPIIGSVPLGTTFHVTGTAPTQYSTVRADVRRPDDGLNDAGVVFSGFCAAGFASAPPAIHHPLEDPSTLGKGRSLTRKAPRVLRRRGQ